MSEDEIKLMRQRAELAAEITLPGVNFRALLDQFQTLCDERDRLIKEHVRLFRLCEPIAKMLSELSILPIGCSREQELAWKTAVKNFRHYQRDYAADVLLQAALTPAGGAPQRWTRERCPITLTCPHCRGKGCEPCKQLGWFFVLWPYPGGQINNACS